MDEEKFEKSYSFGNIHVSITCNSLKTSACTEESAAAEEVAKPPAAPAPPPPPEPTTPDRTKGTRTALTFLIFVLCAVVVFLGVKNALEKNRQNQRGAEQGRIMNAQHLQKETAPNGVIRIVKTVDGVDYAFCWCPPGSFLMGSQKPGWLRAPNELPSRTVKISEGFWMLETEMTEKMCKALGEPIWIEQEDLPYKFISWYDAQDLCAKLHEKGLDAQIPTEAQWEYACRAGTTGDYAGNLDEMAWYVKNCGKGPCGEYLIHPVAVKSPNPWGLYDMHGNVREWCSDKNSPRSERATRGGNYTSTEKDCRSASRRWEDPSSYAGLRIILPAKF